MTQTTSAAERFTLALGAYVRAEIELGRTRSGDTGRGVLLMRAEQMQARLEDAFNEAVDVRMQEALTYANRSDEY